MLWHHRRQRRWRPCRGKTIRQVDGIALPQFVEDRFPAIVEIGMKSPAILGTAGPETDLFRGDQERATSPSAQPFWNTRLAPPGVTSRNYTHCTILLYQLRRRKRPDLLWTREFQYFEGINGGERGIRTPDRVAPMPHFECGAFNHSAISPRDRNGHPCGCRLVDTGGLMA